MGALFAKRLTSYGVPCSREHPRMNSWDEKSESPNMAALIHRISSTYLKKSEHPHELTAERHGARETSPETRRTLRADDLA
jgi:hypothetical protein